LTDNAITAASSSNPKLSLLVTINIPKLIQSDVYR
jgi:hypothetical protein